MLRQIPLMLAVACLALAFDPVSFQTHYIHLGQRDKSVAMASDDTGNIFIVSALVDADGPAGIRVSKADHQGNVVTSYDFNFGYQAVPTSAVFNSKGELLIGGYYHSGFSNQFQRATGSAGFVIRLDPFRYLSSLTLGDANTGGTRTLALAVDSQDNVYVTGDTFATDFPVTAGAYQTTPPPGSVSNGPPYIATLAFVTKLSPDLATIKYSTYYGTPFLHCFSGSCRGYLPYAANSSVAIAVDTSGAAVIAGTTNSVNLVYESGFTSPTGFIAKLSPDGKSRLAATSLEAVGAREVLVKSVALDPSGNVIVGGVALDYLAVPFPSSAIQPFHSGGGTFLARFDAGLKNQTGGTFFGLGYTGYTNLNGIFGLTFDTSGNIWFTGSAPAAGLPGVSSTSSLLQPFVAGITADISSVLQLVPTTMAGCGIRKLPEGTIAVLGSSDAFLLSASGDRPALLTVANSANGVSTGTISPAELISLYGAGIGPPQEIAGQVVDGAFTKSLGGYQVLFNGNPVPILYAAPNQFNVVSSIALDPNQRSCTIEVVGPDRSTVFPTVFIDALRPQMFSYIDPMGTRYAVAVNQDGTLNSKSNPAPPGSIVTLWATGLTQGNGNQSLDGAINPSTPGTTYLPVTVSVGDPRTIAGVTIPPGTLEVDYSAYAPGAILGLTQINVRLSQVVRLENLRLSLGDAVSDDFQLFARSTTTQPED